MKPYTLPLTGNEVGKSSFTFLPAAATASAEAFIATAAASPAFAAVCIAVAWVARSCSRAFAWASSVRRN